MSLRRHTKKSQFYSIDRWKGCITHFRFPPPSLPSHPLCLSSQSFYHYTLFSSIVHTCDPPFHLFLHFSSSLSHSAKEEKSLMTDVYQKRRSRVLLPLLDANPQVIKMPVPLLFLLVSPLFLQHFSLGFLQQLQAVRWQEHVG